MLNPTNLKITDASHVLGMHACMQIQESMKGGGGVRIYLGGLGACSTNVLRFILCHERTSGAI